MSTFLRRFITGCADCQAAKVNTHPTIPRLSPLAIDNPLPFSSISVDLIMGLPDSHGYDAVMVMVDHGLTKGVIYCPCTKDIDSEEVAQLFFTNVFPRFGLHSKIISDRGPQFALAFAQELACLLLLHMLRTLRSPAMVLFFLFLFLPLFFAFMLTAAAVLYKPGCAISAADTSSV